VTGILNPVPAAYAPEIDSAVLVSSPAAEHYLDLDGHPSRIYVRTTPYDQAVTTA
jgi:putative ABC transport system permease protein